jgi:hypothetical protein
LAALAGHATGGSSATAWRSKPFTLVAVNNSPRVLDSSNSVTPQSATKKTLQPDQVSQILRCNSFTIAASEPFQKQEKRASKQSKGEMI